MRVFLTLLLAASALGVAADTLNETHGCPSLIALGNDAGKGQSATVFVTIGAQDDLSALKWKANTLAADLKQSAVTLISSHCKVGDRPNVIKVAGNVGDLIDRFCTDSEPGLPKIFDPYALDLNEPSQNGGFDLLASYAADAAQIRPSLDGGLSSTGRRKDYAMATMQIDWNALSEFATGVRIAFVDLGVHVGYGEYRLNYECVVDFSRPAENPEAARQCESPQEFSKRENILEESQPALLRHGSIGALIAAGKPFSSGDGAGAAPGAKIFDMRLQLGTRSKVSASQVIEAIEWIEQWNVANPEHAIDIVNISLGDKEHDPSGVSPVSTCVDWLSDQTKTLVVVGFGNCKNCGSDPMVMSPASANSAISVAGLNGRMSKERSAYTLPAGEAYFCGANGKPDIAASDIFLVDTRISPNEKRMLRTQSGTSYSSAFVAGSAAVLKVLSGRDLSPREIKAAITGGGDAIELARTKEPIKCIDNSAVYGAGIIDAFKAISIANANSP